MEGLKPGFKNIGMTSYLPWVCPTFPDFVCGPPLGPFITLQGDARDFRCDPACSLEIDPRRSCTCRASLHYVNQASLFFADRDQLPASWFPYVIFACVHAPAIHATYLQRFRRC